MGFRWDLAPQECHNLNEGLLMFNDTVGPSIKYVMLFLATFDPPPPFTLCHTSRDPRPRKYVTHLGTPPDF